jgi:signal transduction histidine kinase
MMEVINDFLYQYKYVSKLAYGLLFFSLGFSVFLHSRNFSRLILAKSLPWLGGFGLLTALYEWLEVVIPLQTLVHGLSDQTVLLIFQQLILGLSLGFLFQFGIELLRPFSAQYRWVRLVPTFILIIWLFGPFIIGFSLIPDIQDWVSFTAGTAARFICLPASVIATVGLIHQQRRQIKPMKLPFIDTMVRFAAGGLAAYGLFGGIFGPKSFLEPGVFLSEDSFIQFVGVTPHFFMSIAGLVLFFSFTRLLEIFEIETEIKVRNMEAEQVVNNERERIARDLHDGALQQVYASGLMAQSLKKHTRPENHHEVDRIINTINQAIEQLREFLPHKRSDVVSVDLAGALLPKIEEAKQYIQVKTTLAVENLPPFSVDQARHLTAFLNEVMSNVIRHSKSTEMDIKIVFHDNLLTLEVRDYGEGISPAAEQGYGLRNMRERARLLGADLQIDSKRQHGTVVKLDLVVQEEKL